MSLRDRVRKLEREEPDRCGNCRPWGDELRISHLRAGGIGDPLVGAAEHQNLHQLLEEHPLGDARAVASERVVGAELRKEVFELLPDGLDKVRWECGHGACSLRSGSVGDSANDGTSVLSLHYDALPINGSSK
jgi:hypothetical protein